MSRLFFQLVIIFFIQISVFGQYTLKYETDKCGSPPDGFKSSLEYFGDNWGYSYDSLLNDISIWETSSFVDVVSIGQSTQGRELYELIVTNREEPDNSKRRIYIHARTHPGEIQSFWVTDEIINFLISDTRLGALMREKCIFHIVPMYNPDGVELEYPRENANSIDIESNWSAETPEKEVYELKERFSELMLEENAIEIALNMHSAYACKRYFVYHHENGTSYNYAGQEQFYINSVREQFLEGIEPWSYYVSWQSSTPTQYPESWWWLNHGEAVLALTYEDMNCSSAGFYDKTAYSMLHGVSDYFQLGYTNSSSSLLGESLKVKTYPNPFTESVTVEWNDFSHPDKIAIYDISGKEIVSFPGNHASNGYFTWDGRDANKFQVLPGFYVMQLVVKDRVKNIVVVKQ